MMTSEKEDALRHAMLHGDIVNIVDLTSFENGT